MRNEAPGALVRGGGGRSGSGRGGLLPTVRAFTGLLKSGIANAGTIANTVRSAGASVAEGVLKASEDNTEQVLWAGFDTLELKPGELRRVLLLTYANGFQVWDIHDAADVRELVSRRDGYAVFLCLLPPPLPSLPVNKKLAEKRPLMAVVCSNPETPGHSTANMPGGVVGGNLNHVASNVRIYTFREHNYVEELRFRTAVLAVRASSRLLLVSLANQIYCFDAASLQNTFSVLTYPAPQPPPTQPATITARFAPVDLGPRWLAYAANQPAPSHVSSTGRASPQHLSPSPGASPSTSPANGAGSGLLAQMMKESGKHIAAGIVSLGDMGLRAASRIYTEHLTDGMSTSGSANCGVASPSGASGGGALSPRPGYGPGAEDCAGTVIVRDVVSRTVVAQFRAHTSPLLALSFDPTGTLLVTASIYGHSLNVYRLTPPSNGASSSGSDPSTAYVHLYKLHRGMTAAVIQNVSFSSDSHWIAVSTTRGTTHLYAICPFGGPVGPHTHGAISGFSSDMDSIPQGLPITVQPSVPWWANQSVVRSSQLGGPPSYIILSAVYRVKNHKGGWKGSVAGAAAAATGRANTIVGAVAAVFHDGGGAQQMQLRTQDGREVGVGTLQEQLYVLSPSGVLLRYLLAPYIGGDNNNAASPGVVPNGFVGGSPSMVFTGSLSGSPGSAMGMSPGGSMGMYGVGGAPPGPGGPGIGGDIPLKLYVEPFEKWDVCRKVFWGDREEKLDSIGSYPSMRPADAGMSAVGIDGHVSEDLHRWYMSHAEVRTHQNGEPLWANPRVHFQVLQPGTAPGFGDLGSVEGNGLGVAVEEIPTKRVLVRHKDLVPLREKLDYNSTGSNQVLYTPRDHAMETLSSDALSLQDSPGGTGIYAPQETPGFGPVHPSAARPKRPSSGDSNSSADGHAGVLPGGHMGWSPSPHASGEGHLHAAAMTSARLPPSWPAGKTPPQQQGSDVLLLERPSSRDERLHNGAVDNLELSVSHMNAPGPEGRLAPTVGPSTDFNTLLDDGRSEDQSSESNTPPSSFESSPSFFHSHLPHQQGLPAAVYSAGPDALGRGVVTHPVPLPPNAMSPSTIIGSPPMAIPRSSSQGELRQGFGQSNRSSMQGSGLCLPEDSVGPSNGIMTLIAPGHGPSRLGPREGGGVPADILCGLPERAASPEEDVVGGVFDFETGSVVSPSSSSSNQERRRTPSRAVGDGLVVAARPVSEPLGLIERGASGGMRDLRITSGGVAGWDARGGESGRSLPPELEDGWAQDGREMKVGGPFGIGGQSSVSGVGDFVDGGVPAGTAGLAAKGDELAHPPPLGKSLPGGAGNVRSAWDVPLPDMDANGENAGDGWDIGDGLFAGDDE